MALVMSLLIGFCFLPESVLSAFFQASQSDPLVPCLSLCLSPRYSAWLTIELRRAVGVVGVAALNTNSPLHGGSSCWLFRRLSARLSPIMGTYERQNFRHRKVYFLTMSKIIGAFHLFPYAFLYIYKYCLYIIHSIPDGLTPQKVALRYHTTAIDIESYYTGMKT